MVRQAINRVGTRRCFYRSAELEAGGVVPGEQLFGCKPGKNH
ncbi:hypothetical protein Daudx_1363 [Candidatus Desulforudis audaxviator]|nr:hypothetical protein Daudx_1363 [Candidatus Desulforudis audaxviator]